MPRTTEFERIHATLAMVMIKEVPSARRSFIPHLLIIAITLLLSRSSAFLLASSRLVQSRRPFVVASRSLLLSMTSSGTSSTTISPPVAERDESLVVYAGVAPPGWNSNLPRQSEDSKEPLLDPPIAIPDPYGWMRDETRSMQKVLDHLNAENEYTKQQTAHLETLRESLYQEMLSSIQETDYTTPRPYGDYAYYTRTFEGKAYTVYCRAPREFLASCKEWDLMAESPVLQGEQVLLDVNELAKDKPYCDVAITTSPSHKLLAYAADFTGDEMCGLYVQDIDTKEIIDHDPELVIYARVQWGADDQTLFYMKMDSTHRPYQLYRRKIGSGQPDELLYEELNEIYWMGIHKSLDDKYLFLEVSCKESTEIWYLDLQAGSTSALECVSKRRDKVLYEVEHRQGQWWISSNVGGLPNLAVFTSPAIPNSEDQWKLVVDASNNTLFDGGYEQSVDGAVTCFQNHIVVTGRQGGLPRVWVLGGINSDDSGVTQVSSVERLTFDEDAYDVGLGQHYEYNTDKVVVTYDSMITPPQSLEIDMTDTNLRQVLKTKNVPGYERSLYGCQRSTVTSRDGTTEIPVSIVYRKDVMEQHLSSGEPVHVHLYGYGSYGSCVEADWRATRLPLLNRGIIYVQAHVRGGGEMGRQWYEEPKGAKYLCKKNTFFDFVDVARWLVDDRKVTIPSKLSCEGRSAGGLLIGASINEAPQLFRAAILGVPFVDVVCTMTDASIPLTTAEWTEWGCPNESKFFEYMLEYCPINNVKKAKYPACLLTGGLHDPRVQYWEVSKFAATLRHTVAEDSGVVCVKMDMTAGHFSASDRYKYLQELSFDYAFLLDQVGLANTAEATSN